MADDLIRELTAQIEELNKRLRAAQRERDMKAAARKARDERMARRDEVIGYIMTAGIVIYLIGVWFA